MHVPFSPALSSSWPSCPGLGRLRRRRYASRSSSASSSSSSSSQNSRALEETNCEGAAGQDGLLRRILRLRPQTREEWQILGVVSVIFMDILYYSFPLPFMPHYLTTTQNLGSAAVGQLAASSSVSSLIAGLMIVGLQRIRGGSDLDERRQMKILSVLSLFYLFASIAVLIQPNFMVLLVSRIVMGGISQASWVFALALVSTMRSTVMGIKAVAWLMLGNSAGELIGPLFGSATYDLFGLGIRPPYLFSSLLMLICTISLTLTTPKLPSRAAITTGNYTAVKESNCEATESIAPETSKSEASDSGHVSGPNLFRDRYFLLLSFLGACTGGTIRGSIDVALPIFLSEVHKASTSTIGQVFGSATVAFAIGSFVSGRIHTLGRKTMSVIAAAVGLLASSIMLPNELWATAMCFAALCGFSGFLGVRITEDLQKYSNRMKQTEKAMGINALNWTAAFAFGGMLANAAGPEQHRNVMVALGIINVVYAIFFNSAMKKLNGGRALSTG